MAHGLEHIDWAAPWLAPYRERGQPLAQLVQAGATVAQALNTPARNQPDACLGSLPGLLPGSLNAIESIASSAWPTFVPQADLPVGRAYEEFIFETRCVPTRDGLHDFFNGVAWLHFPQLKNRLNVLQAQHIAQAGVQAQRGAVRDALTLFDENAALLAAPAPLWDALRQKDWQTLFVTQREQWSQAHLLLFGHALLEKLVTPRKAITAHVLVLPAELSVPLAQGGAAAWVATWDALLARHLDAAYLQTKPYAPLPVLGVPGWWADNNGAHFYDDATVFRPPKSLAP